MKSSFQKLIYSNLFFLLILISCTEKETVTIPDNEPPIVNNVPAIKIENYVNRIFIDLLGREPLDSEMADEVQRLRDADLAISARETLIIKLQTNTDFIEGDTSYQRAFSQHMYNLAKVRCIEGASTAEINMFVGMGEEEDDERLWELLDGREDFQLDSIAINELFGRMIFNMVYDQINMNTFNFVNATFDNLYLRFPTDAEFDAGFKMIEDETPQMFLGETGSSKTDYVNIFVNTKEMFEGLIIWSYQQLLARLPSTQETAVLLEDFLIHKDVRLIQRVVMVTDEYANF